MIALTYSLPGAGWAHLEIITESARITVSLSYIQDSLRELAEAAVRLCDRGESAEVVFMNEPGEHRLRFERRKGDELRAILQWHYQGKRPELETLMETDTNVAQLRREVLGLLARILHEAGEEYQRLWGAHPFPRKAFETLKEGYGGPLPPERNSALSDHDGPG